MSYREYNFDGLVGPTHNYAGLSFGNVASKSNRSAISNPRMAALQGLEKAMALAKRGFPQAILPPHERPLISALSAWGFNSGSDSDRLAAASTAPQLLAAAASASAMWTANACTMAPSCDTSDRKAHFTPANLSGNLHRSIEGPFTESLLKAVFADENRFVVHPPLPGSDAMADEGAANHSRLCSSGCSRGLHLFVFGRSALDSRLAGPSRFPARQTLESVQAIARLHRLPPDQTLFLQQSPEAIDGGVFHNDVISVAHADCLLYHDAAFVETPSAIDRLESVFQKLSGSPLRLIRVDRDQVSLEEAVRTYLFNSQLIQKPDGTLLLVTPTECADSEAVSSLLRQWTADPDNPVSEILSFDLRESMRNGGGPACLRQRIILDEAEVAAMTARLVLDEALYEELVHWVKTHYRSEISPADLADPQLLQESREALDELTQILSLPPIYPFQQ